MQGYGVRFSAIALKGENCNRIHRTGIVQYRAIDSLRFEAKQIELT